jgi:hypothetical protein
LDCGGHKRRLYGALRLLTGNNASKAYRKYL